MCFKKKEEEEKREFLNISLLKLRQAKLIKLRFFHQMMAIHFPFHRSTDSVTQEFSVVFCVHAWMSTQNRGAFSFEVQNEEEVPFLLEESQLHHNFHKECGKVAKLNPLQLLETTVVWQRKLKKLIV